MKYKIVTVIVSAFLLINWASMCSGDDRVYLDITSPFRKVPVVITSAGGGIGGEVSSVIKKALELTGMFLFLDYQTSQAEYTIRTDAAVDQKVTVNVIVSDHAEDKDVIRKSYRRERRLTRAVAHTVTNDFFEVVTGKPGIFRTEIAYIQQQGQASSLNLMDWDGFNDKKIFSSKKVITAPPWKLDGSALGYSYQVGARWRIDIINLKTRNKTQFVQSKGLNLLGCFSPQGGIYFSSSRTGNLEIYKQNNAQQSPTKITTSTTINVSPSITSDGSRLAFVSNRSGSPQIYIMNAGGSNVKRVTFNGSYNTSPQWSPDGKLLAYVGRTNGQNQIFLLKLSDLSIQQLTNQGNNENPSFSPNNMFISFDSDRAGAKGIYIMHIEGGDQSRVTPQGVSSTHPQWSPFM